MGTFRQGNLGVPTIVDRSLTHMYRSMIVVLKYRCLFPTYACSRQAKEAALEPAGVCCHLVSVG